MEFKDFVQLKEADFEGSKPTDRTGSKERGARAGESAMGDKMKVLENTPFINKIAGQFAKYFKGKKSGSMGDAIEKLGIDDHRKGAKGLAYLFARAINHTLFDDNGNRYDLSRETEMGEAKSRLQNISPIFSTLFMLGKDIMKDTEPNEAKMSNLINFLASTADELGVDGMIGLYRKGKELEDAGKSFKSQYSNDDFQDTFTDYYKRGLKDNAVADILKISPDDFEEVYFATSEMPKEILDVAPVRNFAHRLIDAAKNTRAKTVKGGFRGGVPEQDKVVTDMANMVAKSKAVTPDMMDAIFQAIKLYGLGKPSPLENEVLLKTAGEKFGQDFLDSMMKKYSIKMGKQAQGRDSEAQKSISGGGTGEKGAMSEDEFKQFIHTLMSTKTVPEVTELAKAVSGYSITPAQRDEIVSQASKRLETNNPPFFKANGDERAFTPNIANKVISKLNILKNESVNESVTTFLDELWT